ncbi:hypothetical protein E2C01_003809 [Portunus trituberculatus]|uniref:Uncharacterized protein n=1 Tax=Portunus trituberculatus TaxID=210409 RepID=A0A5B7CQR6_PORTR|nr:hypothetical protein [Portunus trituberculatus]
MGSIRWTQCGRSKMGVKSRHNCEQQNTGGSEWQGDIQQDRQACLIWTTLEMNCFLCESVR